MTSRPAFALIAGTVLLLAAAAVLYGMNQNVRPNIGGPAAGKRSSRLEAPSSPKAGPRRINRAEETSADRGARPDRARDQIEYKAASTHLPPLPPGSRVVGFETERQNGLLETVVKIESNLSPLELQIFYTDRLVRDWIIFRDNLTEAIGWSGVFMQIGEVERRLGIFAVVQQWEPNDVDSVTTRISLMLAEEQ